MALSRDDRLKLGVIDPELAEVSPILVPYSVAKPTDIQYI
jgi:hypothetical protein